MSFVHWKCIPKPFWVSHHPTHSNPNKEEQTNEIAYVPKEKKETANLNRTIAGAQERNIKADTGFVCF